LCEGLAAQGHEVSVFTTNVTLENRPDIVTDRPLQRSGVEVNYFPATRDRMGLQSRALEAAVEKRAEDFDVIHVTGVWQPTSRAACRAARRARRPYVCSPRGALGRYSFTQRPWKKWPYFWLWEKPNLNAAAALHYTARMEADECGRLGLRPPAVIVPNSIDLVSWRRDEAAASDWRVRCNLGRDEFVALYVGRMHHKKGLDLLAEIAPQLSARQDWRLVLVGYDEDGSGARLQTEFARIGLGHRLLMLPGVEADALAAIYSAADVFIFPSRHENFGNVAIEALACDCPVLVSDQVGAADQIADLPGAEVLPRRAESWAAALEKRLSKGRARADARAAVEARFAPTSIATRMADTYRTLLAS
jgi:glycosyltransferase involved in cell wall biosynthesis